MSALSRRRALFFGAAVGSALALPIAATNTTNPDAELIALCDQFMDLERRSRSLFPNFCNWIEDDERRDQAIEDITDEQDEIVDQIEELGVHSAEGAKALANAAILWWPHMFDEAENGNGLDGRLIKAVLCLLAPEAVHEAERILARPNHPTAEDIAWARANGGAA